MTRRSALFLVLCAAHTVLSGQDLVKGKIQDRIVCRDDPSQSYALYIPSTYDPARNWPILYAFDPGGRGREPVARFQDAAEARGFIVVCSYPSRNGPWDPIFDAQRKWAEEALEARAAETRVAGVPARWKLTAGVPFDAIVRAAEEEGADMIVMGTHGRRGIEGLLLGSVANRVVRLAGCPVLTVREKK